MMKNYLFSLIMLLTTFHISHGQTFDWLDGEETGYEMNPAMVNYAVSAANDGTVWFAGMKAKKTSYYTMMGDNFLLHFDAQGNRIGEFLISGTLNISAMETDPDGHLYIAGDFIDEDIEFWDGTTLAFDSSFINSFLARINDQGTVDWVKNLDVIFGEYSPVSDMLFKNDLLYLAHSVWLNCFISSVDDMGNPSAIITESNVGILSGMDVDSEGNLYATGSCSGGSSLFNGENYPSPFTYSKYLVKYSPEGIVLWIQFSEDITCIFPQVKVDLDDNVYWTGLLNNSCYFDTIFAEGPTWLNDFYLVKMNAAGSGLWAREVPQVTTGDAVTGSIDCIRVMPDNSITLSGYARGTINWGNGVVTDVPSGGYDALILNFNSDGTAHWARHGGGSYYAVSQCMDLDEEGNVYITGVAHDTITFDDLSLYRETYYYPFFLKLETGNVTSVGSQPPDNFEIYPNPADNYLNIMAGRDKLDQVEIFSLDGRKIHQSRDITALNISFLQPGMYLMRCTLKDKKVFVNKFIKR